MGFIRFLLSFAVVFQHIGQLPYHKFIDAGLAVHCFFIFSGFYIALVLNTKYNNKNIKFYFNRYLRLWPTYCFGVLLSLITLYLSTNWTAYLSNFLKIDPIAKILVVISNIFILGSDILSHFGFQGNSLVFNNLAQPGYRGIDFLLDFPTWSLSIELLFYLIAPFILKSFKKTLIFCSIGIFYKILINKYNLFGLNNFDKYTFDYFTYSIYFGLGGLSFWLKDKTNFSLKEYLLCIVFSTLVLETPLHISSYTYLGLSLLIPTLFKYISNNKIDIFIGNLSYPIYILHIPIYNFIHFLVPNLSKIYIFIIIIIFAIIINIVIEKPIQKNREKIWMSLKTIYNRILPHN